MSTSPSPAPAPRDPAAPPLRVVTFNLLNDLTFWHERSPLVVEGLRALAPDVITLQEVSVAEDNAVWLAEQLGGYSVHMSPKTGARRQVEAIATLARLPVLEHETLGFRQQDRVAQRLVVQHGDARWTVVNAHLHWSLYDDQTRRRQVQRLLDWVPEGTPLVLCGDFNAQPHYQAVRLLSTRLVSVQSLPHPGHHTFPTPLKRGPGVRHKLRSASIHAIGLARQGRLEPWRGTLDYIFVDPSVEVVRAGRVLDQPAPDDPQLYPSDHMGLLADLQPGTLAQSR